MSTQPTPFNRSDYFSTLELLARGWTRHLIDRHLGDPDKLGIDPVSEGGRRRSLYLRTRVEIAETLDGIPERLAAQQEKQEAEAASKAARLQALRADEEAAGAGLPKVTVPLDPQRAAAVLLAHFSAREVRALVTALRTGSSAR
jgi:hypothetical protein